MYISVDMYAVNSGLQAETFFFLEPQCGFKISAAFIRIFLFDFVFSGMPLPSFKIKCIYSTYDLIFITSKHGARIRTCLCSVLFNSKASQKFVSIFKYIVE